MLEADVNPLRRLLSDNGDLEISPNPRLAWFDLEVDSRKTFAEMIEGKARILSWALADQSCWSAKKEDRRILASMVLEADTDVAERKLIEAFFEAVRDYDVLLAWNGDGFDFPVLEGRAAAVRPMPRGRHPLWHRHCWLDAMQVLKKYNAHSHESGEEKTSFALNAVAQTLIGEGKSDFDASKTWEAWEAGGEERARLLAYNEQDTILMPGIEAKTGFVMLHTLVCSVVRCFPDSLSLRATQQGDGFLLRLGAIYGHRWPSRWREDNEMETQYEGAYVMEPTRLGLVENVHVFDFAGLYPSIIRSLNISPEVILLPKQPDPPEGSARLPNERALVRFSKAKRGMFPRALDVIVEKRNEYKAKSKTFPKGSAEHDYYDKLSKAYKIVANSFYGIMGSPWARFFSRDAAEAVTTTGKWLAMEVARVARERGLDAFYGDTDSCYVSGSREVSAQLVDDLNERWPKVMADLGCEKSYIELEFQESFMRIVLKSAKCYAARFSHKDKKPVTGFQIEVKGLEYKRGDSLRITRTMQKQLIDQLLADEVPPVAVFKTFVETWKKRVLEGELTLEEIVMSQSIKGLGEYVDRYSSKRCTSGVKKKCGHDFGDAEVAKDRPNVCPRCGGERKLTSQPAHVRVAKMLAERGAEVRAGTRVEYLIVGDGDEDRLEVIPARDPDALERIDRTYYWEKKIYPPCSRLLEVSFPDEVWVETGAMKRERVKEEKILARRGSVNDLPLFAGSGDAGKLLTVTLDANLDSKVSLLALRGVIEKYPGEATIKLVLESAADGDGAAVLSIKQRVACSDDAIRELERVAGAGSTRVESLSGN